MIPSPCRHRPACPGCPLLERGPYKATLAHKRAQLEAALSALGWTHEVGAIGARRPIVWRARARMVVWPSASAPRELFGFYRRGSREVVPIQFCLVHDRALERALFELRALLFEARWLVAICRFVEARRYDDGALLATLHLGEEPDERALDEARTLAARFVRAGRGRGLELDVRPGRRQAIGGGRAVHLAGAREGAMWLEASGRAVRFGPAPFYQLNPVQLGAVHTQILRWLGRRPRSIVDLYCGVGAHAGGLIAPGARVRGADASAPSVEAARALFASEARARFLAAPDREWGAWLAREVRERPELVVMNPGREGAAREVIAWLGRARPGALVYMSCEPATFVRDAARLARLGIRLSSTCVVDMMPFTDQIETLALFRTGPRASGWGTPAWALGGEPKAWGEGVSGHKSGARGARWRAVVAGRVEEGARRVPGAGAPIAIERVERRAHHTALVLRTGRDLRGDEELRRRLRAWGHPALGDERFGKRGVNWAARRLYGLDRVALHCDGARGEGAALDPELSAAWHGGEGT